MLPPVFIIGCARSGTSILGELFESNSQCEYYFGIELWDKRYESLINKILWKIINSNQFFTGKTIRVIHHKIADTVGTSRKYKIRGHKLTENDVMPEHIEQIKKLTKTLGNNKRLVVKNPRDSFRISFLKKLFPDSKFVHIVRDGRDVTCSLMSAMEGALWEHPKPPGWKKWLHTEVHKKCAWLWNETIGIIKEDSTKISRDDFFEIKYEDLIENPEKMAKILFEELDIPFEEEQKQICKKIQNKMENSYQAKISDKWTRDNHTKRVRRFEENLTKTQLKEVENILGNTNQKFNYQNHIK